MSEGSGSVGDAEDLIQTSRCLRALGHPVRLRIVQLLGERNASAVALAIPAEFAGLTNAEVTASFISYHLGKVLGGEFGLVEVVEERQRRGIKEKIYRLKTELFPDAYQDCLGLKELDGSPRSGS